MVICFLPVRLNHSPWVSGNQWISMIFKPNNSPSSTPQHGMNNQVTYVLNQNISNHYKNHCSPLLPTITHYYINYYYSLHPSTIPSSFLLPVAWTCDEDQRCQKSKVGHNERLLPLGFPRVFLISKMKRYDYWFRYNIDRIIHIFIYIIVHMIIYTYFYI